MSNNELAWTNGHLATFCPDGDDYVVMFNQNMMPLLREKGELRAYVKPEPTDEETATVEELVKSWLRGAEPEKAEYLKMLELASYVHNRAIFQMAREAKLAKPDQSTEYRVGWFTSSSNPRKQVRCLFEGPAAIAEAEKHHSFVSWCDTPKVPFDSTVLESIDIKAEAGMCQMTHSGTRAFLKDIREIVKDALVPRDDETSITHYIGGRMVRHVQTPPGMNISFETEELGVTRVIVSK